MWFCLMKEADLEPRKNFNQKKKKKSIKKVLLVWTLKKDMFGL